VFSPEERERHLYIVGKSGSGKSTFLFNFAMGDIPRRSSLEGQVGAPSLTVPSVAPIPYHGFVPPNGRNEIPLSPEALTDEFSFLFSVHARQVPRAISPLPIPARRQLAFVLGPAVRPA
jgi:hypothetical protein